MLVTSMGQRENNFIRDNVPEYTIVTPLRLENLYSALL